MISAIDISVGLGGWAAVARNFPITWQAVCDPSAECLDVWAHNHCDESPDCKLLTGSVSNPDVQRRCIEYGAGCQLLVGSLPYRSPSLKESDDEMKGKEIDRLAALVDGAFEVVQALNPRWWILETHPSVKPFFPLPLFDNHVYDEIKLGDPASRREKRLLVGVFPDVTAGAPSYWGILRKILAAICAEDEQEKPAKKKRKAKV